MRRWETGAPSRSPSDRPRILAGVPPIDSSPSLLRFVEHTARSLQARVLLATVLPLPRITPYCAAEPFLRNRSARLERIRDAMAGRGVPVRTVVVVARKVSRGLVLLARQRRSDLLMVGWRPPSVPGVLGGRMKSVADRIVKSAPCPVCVARLEPGANANRILVGATSAETLELAISVAPGLQGEPESGGDLTPVGSRSIPVGSRITVVDSSGLTSGESLLDRALDRGADALIAGALEPRGIWPFRWTRLRAELLERFPGSVVLVHLPRGAGEGRMANNGNHSD